MFERVIYCHRLMYVLGFEKSWQQKQFNADICLCNTEKGVGTSVGQKKLCRSKSDIVINELVIIVWYSMQHVLSEYSLVRNSCEGMGC